MTSEEEYEVIPTSPIRRLEKRLEKVETGSYSSEVRKLIEQIMELIQSNQKIVQETIKSNNELRDELSQIPGKIDQLLSEMVSFMKLLRASSEEETGASPEAMKPLLERLTELVEQNKKAFETNQAALTTLGIIDKRLKRLYLQSSGSLGREV
jgi:methyl-accepting chemotaxis protein